MLIRTLLPRKLSAKRYNFAMLRLFKTQFIRSFCTLDCDLSRFIDKNLLSFKVKRCGLRSLTLLH